MKRILFFVCLGPFLFSCACVSNKAFQKALYFRDSITEAEKNIAIKPTIIKPGDRLNITITATDKAAAEAFNFATATAQGLTGYLVDSLGNIQLLQLGTINVSGLTTAKLEDTIENRLSDYLKGPIATISIANFQINMMGEISHPGTLQVVNPTINILQAITQASDLKDDARRDNILIIREENGKRTFGRIDITSNHVFESPFFYLQQNDIVYIEPDRKKYQTNDAQTTRIFRNYSYFLTALTSVILIVNLLK